MSINNNISKFANTVNSSGQIDFADLANKPTTTAGYGITDGGGGSGSGVTTYASIAARDAASASAGDLAWVTAKTALYVYDGSNWDRVYSGIDEGLSWSTDAPDAVTLNDDGTASTFTIAATDPEGFDVTYSYDTTPSSQSQATISRTAGAFTLTPSTTGSDAGEFVLRTKAYDGLNTIFNTTQVSLSFTQDVTFSSDQPNIATTSTNSFTRSSSGSTNTSGSDFSSDLRTGKRYLEVKMTSALGYGMVGICDASLSSAGYSTSTGVLQVYGINRSTYPTSSSGSLGSGSITSGTVIRIAWDTANMEVWMALDDGSWFPNDPSTSGNSGYDMSTSSDGAFKLMLGGGSGSTAGYTANILKNGDEEYTIPTGFSSQ